MGWRVHVGETLLLKSRDLEGGSVVLSQSGQGSKDREERVERKGDVAEGNGGRSTRRTRSLDSASMEGASGAAVGDGG